MKTTLRMTIIPAAFVLALVAGLTLTPAKAKQATDNRREVVALVAAQNFRRPGPEAYQYTGMCVINASGSAGAPAIPLPVLGSDSERVNAPNLAETLAGLLSEGYQIVNVGENGQTFLLVK